LFASLVWDLEAKNLANCHYIHKSVSASVEF
jgi:hypothetical protein